MSPITQPCSKWLALALAALAHPTFAAPPSATVPTAAAVTFGIEAESFQFPGDWMVADAANASAKSYLASGPKGAVLPAATALEIPQAGRYQLWVRAMDFPKDRPGTRKFTVFVGGKKSPEVFGDSGKADFTWERGGSFELKAGPVLMAIQALTPFARADAVLLTTDATFIPSQALGSGTRHRRLEPNQIAVAQETDPLKPSAVTEINREPLARLENEFVRFEFLPATREGRATVRPRVSLSTAQGWLPAPADASSEIYAVVMAGPNVQFEYAGFYPNWLNGSKNTSAVTVEVGGVKLKTARPRQGAVWSAGEVVRFLPRTVRTDGNRARLEFYPAAAGTLAAEWELRPGERTARVQLIFTPAADGQFALGYHLFLRKPLADVKEVLLPMMWHRHRLPKQPRTLLDPFTPTPIALAETVEEGVDRAWALIGEPGAIPFEWPNAAKPHFGLNIRDNSGAVQPSIYGPIPGTDAAKRKAGAPLKFSFRVLVQPGDWYAGFRTAADQVFGLRDYRRNVGVSLTDAALNMVDLVKDDRAGGWWDRAKGYYQIESKNSATHASPLTLLSLYRLTGDEEIYRRRALPTMEFLLSRRSAHFSPVPADTGIYDAGGMDGPVRLFGTTTFGGFAEMTQRRSPAFANVALPQNEVRPTVGYSHAQAFDEWLARYLLTGETNALQRARVLADEYIAKSIKNPPTQDMGDQPFFFISFVPEWEGLLRLYEVTREQRYLDAAVFGARQLMTGLWTQPLVPDGEVTVHPDGKFAGNSHVWWRGGEPYRLGTPRQANDTPEHRVPAWVVSGVGLGFEQPSTYRGGDGGRMIYEMAWAANFLRLAEYTGDRTFETCARNAVIGRWGNYPGYYLSGFTDLPLNPRYPYAGPDVTSIYYHHIVPHLAWTIDYLVAEASLRSGGQITFPAQRQYGYAYFDSRVFGHAPGKVFAADDVWLWLRRGLVAIDNPQLNFLTAHNGNQFFLILMNENAQEESATIRFAADTLKFDPQAVKEVAQLRPGGPAPSLPLKNGSASVVVPARGMVVLRLDGVKIEVPTHHVAAEAKAGSHPSYVTVKTDGGVEVRGAALQVLPGAWDAYVWCTASPQQASKVTLRYATKGGWQQLDDIEYPFEFSIPVADSATPFRFSVTGKAPDGKEFRIAESIIGAAQ